CSKWIASMSDRFSGSKQLTLAVWSSGNLAGFDARVVRRGISVLENPLLDGEESANGLECVEHPVLLDEIRDVGQPLQHFLVLEGGAEQRHRRTEHFTRRSGVCRIDQHRLHDEVKLAQRSNRFLGQNDMVLQKKRDVIQELNRDLAINPKN